MTKILKNIFWLSVVLSAVSQSLLAVDNKSNTAMETAIMVAGGIAVIYAGIKLTQHFSAFRFPKPSGAFGVGTEMHQISNPDQKEKTTRDLTIQFWYPTQKISSKAVTPISSELLMHFKRILPWLDTYGFYSVYTNAQPNAPVAETRKSYPIIIYSHGGMQRLGDNASLCEELASQGYIVVGIGHPQENFIKALGAEKCDHLEVANKEVELRVTETQLVVDYLEKLNEQPINNNFFGHLDLQRIGMAGHSIGGATAIQFCRRDSRCKACVNMDGSLAGKNPIEPFNKPLMLLLGGETINMMRPQTDEEIIKRFGTKEVFYSVQKYYLEAFEALMINMGPYVHKVIIHGAGHNVFCDFSILRYHSIFNKFKEFGMMGNINGFRAHEIMKSYVCAFFDTYLKNQPSELLACKSKKFEEVEVETR